MPKVVSLEQIVAALDLPDQEWESFLDPESGQIVTVTDEDRDALESGEAEDVPEWQRELLPAIREAVESDRFLRLPTSFEIHEWSIMERFGRSIEDPSVQSDILEVLHGTGAFRSFRRELDRHGLGERWYEYRGSAFEQIARDWLGQHGITFR